MVDRLFRSAFAKKGPNVSVKHKDKFMRDTNMKLFRRINRTGERTTRRCLDRT